MVFQEMVVESILPNKIKLIFVILSSEDNVLSDELQSNENRAFRFFGTPGISAALIANIKKLMSAFASKLFTYKHI